ncbi:MAG TPA: YncE family protein [Gemmatimonadales bacterium]|nr:YncE family protein [Gemmatimonadales bacterium]
MRAQRRGGAGARGRGRAIAAVAVVAGVGVAILAAAQAPPAPSRPSAPAPTATYYVYVVSEGNDKVQLLKFGPSGFTVDHSFTTGMMPTDPDGPHGVAVAPDGKHYFVSTGHGTPYGRIWKYATGTDTPEGQTELGLFPATVSVSPDGYVAYVVNFNPFGEKVPSSVSVVATAEMQEIAKVTTCIMPHGSRLSPDGKRHYSACMMDDLAVEMDTRTLKVARYFVVTKGKEKGVMGAPPPPSPAPPPPARAAAAQPASHDMGGHGSEPPKPGDVACSPTWAQPSSDGRRLFVACNKSNDIAVIDVDGWKLLDRWPAGDGVYNLAVTHDGRLLLATNKRDQSMSMFDARTGKELKRLPTKRKVVHGVVVSPDDKYAFVSVEGKGSEPGTVEAIDLSALATVGTVDVGPMAGGVDVWKVE